MFKYLITLTLLATSLLACTNLFVNKGGYHIVARSMDFGMNMGFNEALGYVGQKNTTDVVVDADKIPSKVLSSWEHKYGFAGRVAFDTAIVVDGMNTEGLGVGLLYLPGAEYPSYNPKDKRDALSIYDLSNYVLSQAKNVEEAKKLIEEVQIVNGAIEATDGVFLTNIPVHHIFRDKSGDTLVVEFENKKLNLYHSKDMPVVTNAPGLKWQVENAKKYESLKITNTKPNPEFENRFIDYKGIFNNPHMRADQTALLGLPADYTPPSRFVRSKVLLDNMPAPDSSNLARYQAESVLNSSVVPPVSLSDVTLWITIQDLDEGVFMVRDLLYYNPDGSLYAFGPENGFRTYNLNNLDFSKIPEVGAKNIEVTPKKDVKKIIDADEALKDVAS
ncbi:MAG: linear amide C-N hydrolase [Campylobacterales bacterium]